MTEKESIFAVEYHPGQEVVFRLRPFKIKGLPEPTKKHLVTARKEMLLALRSLLDKAIEKAEKAEAPEPPKRTKIEVQ
ncbi:MAG: hypothetical protein HY670_04340 [Chloroflexi bacterium]|nr:hypothetical protein [Chloroflexota bacterium]